jgi:hypothetical protein
LTKSIFDEARGPNAEIRNEIAMPSMHFGLLLLLLAEDTYASARDWHAVLQSSPPRWISPTLPAQSQRTTVIQASVLLEPGTMDKPLAVTLLRRAAPTAVREVASQLLAVPVQAVVTFATPFVLWSKTRITAVTIAAAIGLIGVNLIYRRCKHGEECPIDQMLWERIPLLNTAAAVTGAITLLRRAGAVTLLRRAAPTAVREVASQLLAVPVQAVVTFATTVLTLSRTRISVILLAAISLIAGTLLYHRCKTGDDECPLPLNEWWDSLREFAVAVAGAGAEAAAPFSNVAAAFAGASAQAGFPFVNLAVAITGAGAEAVHPVANFAVAIASAGAEGAAAAVREKSTPKRTDRKAEAHNKPAPIDPLALIPL